MTRNVRMIVNFQHSTLKTITTAGKAV